MIAYRNAAGFGIRLDAGSAFTGANISPFFDSLLVNVTTWERTLKGATVRLHRALREYRIRRVKTNIAFLRNVLTNETFQARKATVTFIDKNSPLTESKGRRLDRGPKMLSYLGNVIINEKAMLNMLIQTKYSENL